MKKIILFTLFVAVSFNYVPHALAVSYVEFKPGSQSLIPPSEVNKKVLVSKSNPTNKVLTNPVVNNSYIKNLVTDTVNNLLAQGLLKGQKGDKGDPASFPTMDSIDPNSVELKQVYIPGAVSAANSQTFLAATNLSGDNITVNSVNTGDLDSTGGFTSEGNAQFSGNVSLATTTVVNLNVGSLTSDSGAFLSDGGVWTNASSKELKENFASVSPESILDKINQLPIYQWNYKKEDVSVTHIGPTAEDFYNAFTLGGEKGKISISTIDPSGVALSGIQALSQQMKQLLDFSWILDSLKSFGLEISQDLIKAKNLIANSISTQNLEVGSSDKPSGITIYDRATGQPVCIFSENNTLKSQAGKCDVALNNAPEAPSSVDDPPQIPPIDAAMINATTTATSSPDSQVSSPDDSTTTPPLSTTNN